MEIGKKSFRVEKRKSSVKWKKRNFYLLNKFNSNEFSISVSILSLSLLELLKDSFNLMVEDEVKYYGFLHFFLLNEGLCFEQQSFFDGSCVFAIGSSFLPEA